MGMEYYYSIRNKPDVKNVSVGFDTSQFGDVELFGTLMQFKETQGSFWKSIGIGGSICAEPLIHGNTIYIGACDKNFYAIDKDGNERWRFKTNGVIVCNASAHGNLVYFCSYDNNLYAINIKTGNMEWTFHANDFIGRAPDFDDDKLYFGSCDGNLYCLDAKTGREQWRFKTSGEDGITPLIHEGRLY
ncbi:MAG: hypothetical protein FJY76_03625, partial [Candidatus Aenigmarchaeota archaeon]|nr:hypothetical protein [Candidatus Aenigmarchaeota archaeon]